MKLNLRPTDPGIRVPFPGQGVARTLSPDGERVDRSHYWLRRLRAGEVEETTERTEVAAVTPPESPKPKRRNPSTSE